MSEDIFNWGLFDSQLLFTIILLRLIQLKIGFVCGFEITLTYSSCVTGSPVK